MAAIKPDAIDHKEEIMGNIRDSGFHIVAEKKLALTREIAEEFYKVYSQGLAGLVGLNKARNNCKTNIPYAEFHIIAKKKLPC